MARLKQGMVQGPGTGTSDSILARVSNGEYILPKAVVDIVGKKSLDNLRHKALAFQRVPRYAMGGEVNDTSLTDSYNRATATTQATNQMLRGGATATPMAVAPAAAPTNAFAQQQAAYNTARSSADPLDVASGRFDKGYQAPMAPPMARNPMAQDAFASQQAAYNTAKSSADTLDVASGRFDKGYQAPRFKDGGLVDDVVAIRNQQQADEKKRLAAQAIQKQTPQGPQVVRGTPWQAPTTVSPEAQQSARRAEAFLNQRVDLTPKNNLAVPVPVVANNMASAPAPKPPAEITPLPARTPPAPAQTPLAQRFEQTKRVDGSASFAPGTGLNDASVLAGARGRNISVGARTDAEAARNVQSRLEQDAAASQVVASMNRGAEAMRDTRAAKLGISRGTLDQMEGRLDSPNIQRAAPEAPEPPGVFDRPGDGFGDAGLRRAKYEGFLNDAANAKGLGSKRRSIASLTAAERLLDEGKTRVEQDTANRKTLAEQQSAQQSALAALQGRQMQEAGENRRADLNARTQLGTTALAQQGQNQRAQMEAQQKAEEKAFDRLGDKWKAARDLFEKDYDKQAFSAFAASPELPQILAGMGYDTEAKRAQFLTNPDENQVNEMVRIYNANKGNSGSWFFGMGKKTPIELGETLKR